MLESLQVVRVGSAACTAFIGSFIAAVACRRAAAFSGVTSVLVIEVPAAAALQLPVTLVPVVKAPFVEYWLFQAKAALCHPNALERGGFVTPVVDVWLLQAAAALCHPNALVDVLSTFFYRFLFDPGGLYSGFEWACSGTSDLGMRPVETRSRIRFDVLKQDLFFLVDFESGLRWQTAFGWVP